MVSKYTDNLSPVYGYQKHPSMIDYPGRMAVLLFLSGCNFVCGYCHNPELIRRKPGLTWQRLELILRGFKQNWVNAVCISGGEPTVSPNLEDLIRFVRNMGFAVKLDTNGSRPGCLEHLLPLVDYVAMDVKTGLEDYRSFVRFSAPGKIRESISALRTSGVPHELRTTVLTPYHNDARLHAIGRVVEGSEIYTLQPFIPSAALPDTSCRVLERTTPERMREAAEILRPYVKKLVLRGAGRLF